METKTQQEVNLLNLNVGYFSEILETLGSTIEALENLEEEILADKQNLVEKLSIARIQIAEAQATNASELVAVLKG